MHNISKPLQKHATDVGSIIEDPANVREHSEQSIVAIKASLIRFGQQKPIVLRKDGLSVLAGNGTLRAAKELGWTKIAAIKTTLDNADAVAYGIADNRTTELSDWDYASLGVVLNELDPSLLETTGFAQHDLDNLMTAFKPGEVDQTLEEFTPDHDKGALTLRIPSSCLDMLHQAVDKMTEQLGCKKLSEQEGVLLILEEYIS
jgi:hypothetical protein